MKVFPSNGMGFAGIDPALMERLNRRKGLFMLKTPGTLADAIENGDQEYNAAIETGLFPARRADFSGRHVRDYLAQKFQRKILEYPECEEMLMELMREID